MRITAPDLKELGVIDGIIPEITGGAHRNVAKQALYIKECISDTLKALNTLNGEQLVEDRYEKFKKNRSIYRNRSIKKIFCEFRIRFDS